MKNELPTWSISILPDCKTAVYNTARVGSQSSVKQMTPVSKFSWQSYIEESASSSDDKTFTTDGLWEQLNDPLLNIWSPGHALHVFINGQLSGTVYGGIDNPKLSFSQNVKMRVGENQISLLSIICGSSGTHFEQWNAGVLGPVTLKGLNEGTRDFSKQKWSYKIGLKCEDLSFHTVSRSISIEWVERSSLAQKQPLTWYHVPRSWLNSTGNLLVVFEEWGGDPKGITLVKRATGSVCADIF
ncbi:hypothetical protein Pint_07567 [Pistacia integerrima]|uniref:Uncharacterized protein n=1 Tax=Pistacia integerrima TaxID=434235 RepID=A0ACC0XX40_9ROSI|nr:hypothetical protein Pint_07567 [Pistacia integerrima]